MEDFFVDESMDKNVGAAVKKAALKAMKKKPLPCGTNKKSKRVAIFSPWPGRFLGGFPWVAFSFLRARKLPTPRVGAGDLKVKLPDSGGRADA